jgi:hypothetical protein
MCAYVRGKTAAGFTEISDKKIRGENLLASAEKKCFEVE